MPQRITWNGPQVLRAARSSAARGLHKYGELVLERARAEVPHESGDLERSGRVTPATIPDDDLRCAVVFDTPYAVRQHEDQNMKHAPGRGAKYLENAFNATRREGPMIVATEIRRALGT